MGVLFEDFKRLNQAVYVREPLSTSSSSSPKEGPDVVLVAGWLNGLPRHAAKYAAGYERMYPTARILIVTTSTLDIAFLPHSLNVARIAPALDILYGLPADAKVLLHLFSNGGAFKVALIARTYREKTGRALPLAAVVFDSTPGKLSYDSAVRANASGLPRNFILRSIGLSFFSLCYGLYRLFYFCTRTDNLILRVWKELNSKAFFDVDAPRLYIYSVADDLVAWRDVEEHGEEAERVGYVVLREKFADSAHVAHMMNDDKRYWAAVQRLWRTVNAGRKDLGF